MINIKKHPKFAFLRDVRCMCAQWGKKIGPAAHTFSPSVLDLRLSGGQTYNSKQLFISQHADQ